MLLILFTIALIWKATTLGIVLSQQTSYSHGNFHIGDSKLKGLIVCILHLVSAPISREPKYWIKNLDELR